VAKTFKDLFEDADSLIQEATEEAQRLMRKNRGEVRRIGGQLAEIEKNVGSLTRLLCDPDIDAAAKKAISRQLGEQEAQRERLQKATSGLAEEANDGTERLAAAVRQALDEAKESLAAAATTAELREFVDRWVGPMTLKADGTVVERALATEDASEASVKGLVAGAGFVAIHNLFSPFLRRCWALPRRGRHFQTT